MPEDPAKYTPFLKLYKPDQGEAGWGPAMNTNLDVLDEQLQGLGSLDNVSISKLGGNAIATGAGVVTLGTLRVINSSDDPLLTKIEENTKTSATNILSLNNVFSSPLGIHLLDETNATIGIHARPLVVCNSINGSGESAPLIVALKTSSGKDLDTGNGSASQTTLRTTTASNSPEVVTVNHIDDNISLSMRKVTLPDSSQINLQNTLLKDDCGQLIGVEANPLFVTAPKGTNVNKLDSNTISLQKGIVEPGTQRVTLADNDTNLNAVNNNLETLIQVAQNGQANPPIIYTIPITVSKGNGRVNPETAIVTKGSDLAIYMYPDDWWEIESIYVDKVNKGTGPNPYLIPDVNANHVVEVNYKQSTWPITVTSEGPGIVSPNGVVAVQNGSNQSFRATPNTGCHIHNVYRDGVLMPNLNSDQTFSNVIGPHTFHVEFMETVGHKITATSTGQGVVSPAGASVVPCGQDFTYTFNPVAGWTVGQISIDGELIEVVGSSYTFYNVKTSHTIAVTFTMIGSGHTISATSVGSGTITPAGNTVLGQGGNQTYTLAASPSWHIHTIKVDNVVVGNTNPTQTFTNVTANHTIQAIFHDGQPRIITATAEPHGSISPSGSVSVPHEANQVFTFTPEAGYRVASITVDGVKTITQDGTYTFNSVDSNHSIDVEFAMIGAGHRITSTVSGSGVIDPAGTTILGTGGNQSYTITPSPTWHINKIFIDGVQIGNTNPTQAFTNVQADHSIYVEFNDGLSKPITASAGSNGSISPAGTVMVPYQSNQTYTITPVAGYRIASITVDGVAQADLSNTYTFEKIDTGHTIAVTFAMIGPGYTVTASSTGSGTVTPAGVTTLGTGGNQTYNITPAATWHAHKIIADGVETTPMMSSYTFSNVSGNHTLGVEFHDGQPRTIVTSVTSAVGSGSISPGGSVSVAHEADQVFTIVPAPGWGISAIMKDGVNVGNTNTTQSFSKVVSNHSLAVSFAVTSHTISATAGLHGSITPTGSTTVEHGTNYTYTMTPDDGYIIYSLKIDSIEVPPSLTYTFTNVTKDHTIDATFTAITECYVGIKFEAGGRTSYGDSSVLNPANTQYSNGMTGAVWTNGLRRYGPVGTITYMFEDGGGASWDGAVELYFNKDTQKLQVWAYSAYGHGLFGRISIFNRQQNAYQILCQGANVMSPNPYSETATFSKYCFPDNSRQAELHLLKIR